MRSASACLAIDKSRAPEGTLAAAQNAGLVPASLNWVCHDFSTYPRTLDTNLA